MAVTTTTTLSNSLQTLLQAEYLMAVRRNLVYAQPPIAWTPPAAVIGSNLRSQAISIPMYGELAPQVSAISQTQDVVPITSWDAVVTITPDMYGAAVQLSKKLQVTATPDVVRVSAEQVARNAGESIDYIGRTAAVGGNTVTFGGTASARGSIVSTGTNTNIAYSNFQDAVNFLSGSRAPKIPGLGPAGYGCILRLATLQDVIKDSNIVLVAEYSFAGNPPNLLTGEVGTHMAGVRMIESNHAKIFHGAGTSSIASSGALSSARSAGTTYIDRAADSSGAVGQYWTIGTVESTANGENSIAEAVLITGGTASTVVTIVGAGINGGLLYDHPASDPVTHAHQVYATVFFGGEALVYAYTNDDGLGREGRVFPPEDSGLLKQFTSLGWRWFGAFAISAQNRIFRVEHSCSRYTLGA